MLDLSKPYWQCICGTRAMPLTDDTKCQCPDYYLQEWSYIDPSKPTGPPCDK